MWFRKQTDEEKEQQYHSQRLKEMRELELLKIRAKREELLARTEAARAKKISVISKRPAFGGMFGKSLDLGIGLPKSSKRKKNELFGDL